jgi:hypothetical protein
MESESNSRGIVVYIDNKFDYSIIECKTKFKEYLVIKIKSATKKDLYLCVIYRSPNSTEDNNNLLLKILLKCVIKRWIILYLLVILICQE